VLREHCDASSGVRYLLTIILFIFIVQQLAQKTYASDNLRLGEEYDPDMTADTRSGSAAASYC